MNNVIEHLKNNKEFLLVKKENDIIPPVLLTKSENVDINSITPEIAKQIKEELVKIAKANDGVGLAANQIGFAKNFFVFKKEKENKKGSTWELAINPSFKSIKDITCNSIEGCLSFPGTLGVVERFPFIEVSYYDENLQKQKYYNLTFESNIIFQHEYDHLQGKVIYAEKNNETTTFFASE